MRPADSSSVHQTGVGRADVAPIAPIARIDSAPAPVPVTLGVPVCAICYDTSAAPMLAGDRARGPDYLYLVCDRCGSRWQCLRVLDVKLAADD